ncbi:MAG: M36 family metallopeptidase, partial [Planctomycetes bacterium]|nr:M36 family metallopeptidase [Planctomycetota bacterium]
FSEAAGNFQNDTFGRGGSGNDAVQADAQDGSGVNNANFSWAADGTPGRMQMFLWSSPSPRRDGDLDATVIIHEYCHGLSNRLIGGGVGISQLQPAGMGEGWSDFYALALLSDPADDVQGTYAVGSYIANGLVADNYYRGIRRYPYAIEPGPSVTSGSKNPLTLSDIIANTEVHKQGEVWCMALWEARAQLIGKLGGAVGNQTMLRLVTDGLKLSPPNPTFLEARDAILQADLAANGGANLKQLWIGFAKRGMGLSATVPDSSTTTGVVQAFDVPGDLLVTSTKGFASGGAPGGPFAPTQASYTLRNISESNLSWSATRTVSWIVLSSAGGTLAPHATTTVTVSLTAAAAALPIGDYHDAVTFTNATSGSGTTSRAVDLDVANNYTLGPVGYSWIDASGHTQVDLGAGTASDDAASAALTLPFPFRFYGKAFSTIYVGSNGLLGFAPTGMNQWENTDLPDSTLPNAIIAPWWDDLYPPQPGARVTVGLAGSGSSRVFVITWTNVPSVNAQSQGFTFQALLMEGSNDIIFQYQEVRSGLATYGAGRSATIGIESTSGAIARTYSFNGSALVANGQAILFHLPIPSAATPTISPAAGSYAAPLSVTIASTPGTAIRYTIDGSTPSPSNGTVYTGQFILAANATVRAFASGTDFIDSGIASAAYVLTTAPPSTPTSASVTDDANGRSGGSCGVGTGIGVLLIALATALRAAFTRPRASAAR